MKKECVFFTLRRICPLLNWRNQRHNGMLASRTTVSVGTLGLTQKTLSITVIQNAYGSMNNDFPICSSNVLHGYCQLRFAHVASPCCLLFKTGAI